MMLLIFLLLPLNKTLILRFMNKRTLVLGASPTPVRPSYKAVKKLLKRGHDVVAIGKQESQIETVDIITDLVDIPDLDTITIYLNAEKQEPYLDYIIDLAPKRIIFNPGSYNHKLEKRAISKGIEVLEDCTLIMLDNDDY
jgi:uncharacterized protein